MNELMLSAAQAAQVLEASVPDMTDLPLTEAKRLVAAAFERQYLVRVIARANGSVSEGARLAGLHRTNFRRLLHRHDLR